MKSGLVVVSNRGPLSVAVGDGGELEVRHAAGGLAPSLARALSDTSAVWVAAALGEGERRLAKQGPPPSAEAGVEVRLVDVDDEVLAPAYNVIANKTLWFLHHGLFDRARQPLFDRAFYDAWDAYRSYNATLAAEVAECAAEGARVVVNDYHLSLVGAFLAEARPDLATVHFSHTPFCTAEELSVLPRSIASELVSAMGSFGACGFHTSRWAGAFSACLAAVSAPGRPEVFVSPLGVDPDELGELSAGERVGELRAGLEERLGGRALLLRSDRIEPSKNLIRGFLAFEELLAAEPSLVDRVLFIARTYPSRTDLAEYREYRAEIERVVGRVNERFSVGGRSPIELEVADDFEATLAALCRYDVLLVNPVRDGMNLVAKEGPVLNSSDGVLALSREAGAFDELGAEALAVEPLEVSQSAAVLGAALSMAPDERHRRAGHLRSAAGARPPRHWFADVAAKARVPTRS